MASLRAFRSGPGPRCAPQGKTATSACPLYDHCPRWHGEPDDRLATFTETAEETERRQAAWPCSMLLDLLTPDLTRIAP